MNRDEGEARDASDGKGFFRRLLLDRCVEEEEERDEERGFEEAQIQDDVDSAEIGLIGDGGEVPAAEDG